MNAPRLVLLATAFVTAIYATAADDTPTGSPSSLFDGKMPATLVSGAEDARNFTNGAVIVRLKSTPTFGVQPVDWPVVQVGPMALTFIREGDKGRIGVARGNDVSLLTEEFLLDADGRVGRPLEIILGCDPIGGTLVYAVGDKVTAAVVDRAQLPVGVSFAAGLGAPWNFAEMEIIVLQTEEGSSSSKREGLDSAGSGSPSGVLKRVLTSLKRGNIDGAAASDATSTASLTQDNKAALPRYIPLEISTQPAVRRSASEVRAALAQAVSR